MFLRIPVRNESTGDTGLLVLEIEDRSDDPFSSLADVDVVPALIAEGLSIEDLVRLNDYRSAIMHGYCTDQLRPGEPEHIGPVELSGEVHPLYGLTEVQRNYILWLHADHATGRLGGPNDGEIKS